jgi:polysaccharide deacetylase family sporulation protein PdaB
MAVLLITGALIAANRPGNAVEAAVPKKELPIYAVHTEEKLVSLSFDAAWGNEDTQQLIDILEQYDVKATFFVVGDWARKYPESVKALFDAGHEIMNHSNKHDHMPRLSAEQIASDLAACNQSIEDVTGVKPTLFRLPYGDYDCKTIRAVRAAGMETIQWDVDSLDWKDVSAQQIIDRVTTRVKPGSIVLFHNAAKNTPAALPGLIEKLQADGYKMIKISELIYPTPYT